MNKNKRVKGNPVFNQLFVTADMEEKSEGGIIMTGNVVKDMQRILAVGPNVPKSIEVDDIIKIDWRAYITEDTTRKNVPSELEKSLEYQNNYTVAAPLVDVEGVLCMRLNDRDIVYTLKPEDLIEEAKTQIKVPEIVTDVTGIKLTK